MILFWIICRLYVYDYCSGGSIGVFPSCIWSFKKQDLVFPAPVHKRKLYRVITHMICFRGIWTKAEIKQIIFVQNQISSTFASFYFCSKSLTSHKYSSRSLAGIQQVYQDSSNSLACLKLVTSMYLAKSLEIWIQRLPVAYQLL